MAKLDGFGIYKAQAVKWNFLLPKFECEPWFQA